MAEIPDWLFENLRPDMGDAAFFVVAAMFRHGRQDVSPDGGHRRCKLSQTSTEDLAKLAGISRRTAHNAVQKLHTAGWITIHNSVRAGGKRAFSVLYDVQHLHTPQVQEGATFAHPRARVEISHGDGDTEILKQTDQSSPPLREESAEVAQWLLEEGVSWPSQWLSRWGLEMCHRAIVAVDCQRERGYELNNPAGFMASLLRADRLPTRDEQYAALDRYKQGLAERAKQRRLGITSGGFVHA